MQPTTEASSVGRPQKEDLFLFIPINRIILKKNSYFAHMSSVSLHKRRNFSVINDKSYCSTTDASSVMYHAPADIQLCNKTSSDETSSDEEQAPDLIIPDSNIKSYAESL